MNTHILKSKSAYFSHLIDGNFFHSELRDASDRSFNEGDHLHFIEIDSRQQITGRIVKASIHKVKRNSANKKDWVLPESFVLLEFFVFEIIQ